MVLVFKKMNFHVVVMTTALIQEFVKVYVNGIRRLIS